jgi:hypothetical protein
VNLATAGLPARAPVPIVTPLSRKFTTPLAAVFPLALIVAVNVTGLKYVEGFPDDVIAIVVAVCTVSLRTCDVLPSMPFAASPPYVAVIG